MLKQNEQNNKEMRKYKTVKRSITKALKLLSNISKSQPNLFYHWKIGVILTI